jgi:hypothetical protein
MPYCVVVFYVVADVSEEDIASIFKVQVFLFRVRKAKNNEKLKVRTFGLFKMKP